MTDTITVKQFHESEGAEDWRVVGDGASAFYRTSSFAESAGFVAAIGGLTFPEGHVPDIDIRHDGVTARVVTHTTDYFGMSRQDVEVARQVSMVARQQGLQSDPSAIQSILIIPGGSSTAEIMPFWQAALGYEPRLDSPAEDLVDPHNRGPAFWFERMNELRADGNGSIHVAVWMPYEHAEARVAAALAAGGHVVRDQFGPAWWTLADAAGNEIDISTPMHRD